MALTDLFSRPAPDNPNAAKFKRSANPLATISSGRGYLDTLTNKFILKPASAKGLAGFVFDYEGDTQVVVQSDISDHFTEQNAFFNDQAAKRPQRVTLRGFAGELVQKPDLGLLGALNVLQNKLTSLEAITGKYTPSVIQKIQKGVTTVTSTVNKIDDAISRAQNLVGLFVGSAPGKTRQQLAYQKLFALWESSAVFTLDTPFNYFQSMMIEHMIFIQDDLTNEWSEISVTVKEVRFIGTVLEGPGLSAQLAAQTQMGRSKFQSQSQINKGQTQGTAVPIQGLKDDFIATV